MKKGERVPFRKKWKGLIEKLKKQNKETFQSSGNQKKIWKNISDVLSGPGPVCAMPPHAS